MELTLSQSQVTAYLNSLDLNNVATQKVFVSLQLLTPELFNNTISLLIDGRLTLNTLNSISINNATIKAIIDGLLAAPTNIVEKSIYYKKNLIDSLSMYTAFLDKLKVDTVPYIAKKSTSFKSFLTEIKVDSLGIDRVVFQSLQTAKNAYNSIKLNHPISTDYLINNIVDSNTNISVPIPCSEILTQFGPNPNSFSLYWTPVVGSISVYINGILQSSGLYDIVDNKVIVFNNIIVVVDTDIISAIYTTFISSNVSLHTLTAEVLKEINSYKLIYSTESLPPSIPFDKSTLGFLLRIFYNQTVDYSTLNDANTVLIDNTYVDYINLKDNTHWFLNELATDYDTDTSKNGIFTLTRLLHTYTWDRLNAVNNFTEFYNELSKLVFIRITVVKWFTTGGLPLQMYLNEQVMYGRILKYMYNIRNSLVGLTTEIEGTIYDYVV